MKLCGRYLFLLPVLFLLGCPKFPARTTPIVQEVVELETAAPDVIIKRITFRNAGREVGWFGVAKTPEGWLIFDGANHSGNPNKTTYIPDKDHVWIKGFDEKS